MKKNLQKTAAFIFALVLIIISAAKPQKANAQEKKVITKSIVIKNGDTIINGKNLKNASKSGRKKLLKEFNQAEKIRVEENYSFNDDGNKDVRVIIRKQKDGEPEEVVIKRLKSPNGEIMLRHGDRPAHRDAMMHRFEMDGDSMSFKIEVDSILKRVRIDSLGGDMQPGFRFLEGGDQNVEFFMTPDGPMAPKMPMISPGASFRFERPDGKNSQSFSYHQTDKEGISNHLSVRLHEANAEALKKITGSENSKTDLGVEDLTFFPSFSTGKLNLAFSLKTKGSLLVKILNSNFETVFTDQAANFNESYYKSLNLAKNGIYYLAISQNGQWFIKKMVKE